MKRAAIIGLLISLFGLALVLTRAQDNATPESTAEPSNTPALSIVLTDNIYVRSGPGQDFIPVGRLDSGNLIYPLNRNEDATWVMIRYNAGYGWIRRDLARWVQDIDSLPVADVSNLTPTPELDTEEPDRPISGAIPTPNGNWVDVDDRGAFVRSGPDFSYPQLGVLQTGELVEPVGRDINTAWILIRHNDGFAWILRTLVRWQADLETLPILYLGGLTPSPTFTDTSTPTPTDTPTSTFTPSDTPTDTPTFTPTDTPSDTPTPTFTNTDTPTFTPSDTPTYTLTFTPSDTPTLTDTPTQTPTHTLTPTPTASHTLTPAPTDTPSPTPSDTPTSIPSDTPPPTDTEPPPPTLVVLIVTATVTNTSTVVPSDTPAPTATDTATAVPSDTLAPTDTDTPQPSDTPTSTHTDAPTATATPEPTEVAAVLVASDTLAPTATDTPTEMPTSTPTALPTSTDTAAPSDTAAPLPSATDTTAPTAASTTTPTTVPTDTLTNLPTASDTDAPSETASEASTTATNDPTDAEIQTEESTPVVAVASIPTPLAGAPQSGVGGAPRFPLEGLVGGLGLLLVLAYVGFFWRGLTAQERYRDGFVISRCPVCREGTLIVDEKQDRLLGIPRVKRAVRCSHCRSVLRETGLRRWRYAIDPVENPGMYQRYNGRVIEEDLLKALPNQPHIQPSEPPEPHLPVTPPSFVDDDPEG